MSTDAHPKRLSKVVSPEANHRRLDAFESINIDSSLSDFVKAGLHLRVMVGVDLTRSNGDPRANGSLHAVESDGSVGEYNEYAPVLRSVLSGLQEISAESMIDVPVYGFGAKLPPSRTRVSHCFSLKGDYFNPLVSGVEDVLQAYTEVLEGVIVHGPTRFSELLRIAIGWAQSLEGSRGYLIVVLVTDGSMSDLSETIDVLVDMSNMPVSIVIVGVGEADFSKMDLLDGDTVPLVSARTGHNLTRDSVQFVRHHDYTDSEALVQAALSEIPKQVGEYFWARNGIADSLGSVKWGDPRFLSDEKTSLLVTIHNQGYEEEIAERLVEESGVFSSDPLHVIDVMFFQKRRMALSWTSSSHPSGKGASLADRFGLFNSSRRSAKKPSKSSNLLMTSTKQLGHRDKGNCRVCFTNHINATIQPCGHEIVCSDCSTKIGKLCPLCRATIDTILFD